MKKFNLEIITPSKSVFNDSVVSATFPGTLGEFQVLFNHADLMSVIEIGRLRIEKDGETLLYATSGGTVEVKNNKVLFLAETIEESSLIDLERAKRALERAQDRLRSENRSEVDFSRAEAALQRALNRIKVVEN
ncbi:MAG TPA: F0F1 ATP synthase subunit epsilon [Ignavibacteriaceae bacterium]|nr:F0F1 ATP synthase subunit epsilon [Ignavibacteriaceae bacterium]